jgi:D-beta-D-heptose 7-phosphate kinase/D-beta-D-heptose 1-phosphate adenosyltransferase
MNTQALRSLNVLLIGDSCIDEYKIGTVDRLSPEAPVPVIKIVDNYTIPGMAANVDKNLQSLGIEPDFITNDSVIKKTRYIDKRSGQHLLRVDDESDIVPWSGRIHLSPIESYDAIVISDYNKGFLTYEHIENIIKSVTCPVFIDTKKQDLSRFSADNVYVKINELEYKTSISRPAQFIVTLGDRGAMFTSPSIGAKMFETKRVEVMDVCGCGDTFLASLAYGYLSLGSIESAIIFANVAAGITVQHRGNYAPSYQEIKNAGY